MLEDQILIRQGTETDIPAIWELIQVSARSLGRSEYSEDQVEAALGTSWGVDRNLIADGTMYLIEIFGELGACGAWSRRTRSFGASESLDSVPTWLNPASDPALIRAFFVHPKFARKGLGSRLLEVCESKARNYGFTKFRLVATKPGSHLYLKHGYQMVEPLVDHPRPGVSLEFFGMEKSD
jgi:GNAT superfamily N-acetyltransferase